MLNTKKLLYILPDLAYVAELLPAKKEHSFSLQTFKQINGEFLNDNEFIPENVEKLFSKLEEDEYHLILPDFIFTNTIATVKETSNKAVLEHIEKKLLPKLDLSNNTHEIKTEILTSFKGTSKIQISAIEKSVLSPIRAIVSKSKIKIVAISPLTWTVKSIVSLEPSITVLQMGSYLYAAQHYIGVDQAINFSINQYDSIIETIKTLKGAEPSIQSVYLASNSIVEEDIKEKLSDTLPIQQLATYKEDDSKMPSYVKFIIESSMRTLSILDFPVPRFELGKASEEDLSVLESSQSKATSQNDKDLDPQESNELPQPSTKEVSDKKENETDTGNNLEKEEKIENKTSSKTVESAPSDLPTPSVAPIVEATKNTESTPMTNTTDEKNPVSKDELPTIPELDTTTNSESKEDIKSETDNEEKIDNNEKSTNDTTKESSEKNKDLNEIDLSQFASKESEDDNGLAVEAESNDKSDPKLTEGSAVTPVGNLDKSPKKIIKNSSGVNNMLKMVFITIAVFFITIAIGVGVGLGLLKVSDNKTADTTPTIVEETPEPTATPTPTPEPVEINKDELSILVVNATTKAGYAGKIKSLLIDAEIKDISAANAKGDYEEGTDYVLMKEENSDLINLLEESTELSFEFSEKIAVEDAANEYDAVIVLAK